MQIVETIIISTRILARRRGRSQSLSKHHLVLQRRLEGSKRQQRICEVIQRLEENIYIGPGMGGDR